MLEVDFKKRWIEALRSHKYKQGRGRLCQVAETPDEIIPPEFDMSTSTPETRYYCCLGVAALLIGGDDIFVPSELVVGTFGIVNLKQASVLHRSLSFTGNVSAPPYTMIESIGLTVVEQNHLIRLNDSDRLNFDQIATYIEDNL